MYQLLPDGGVLRLADGTCIPEDHGNTDYRAYLAWVADGNEPAADAPLPDPGPTRDERLLDAVDQAKTDVTEAVKAGIFTQQQALALASVFDKLGQAIAGGGGT